MKDPLILLIRNRRNIVKKIFKLKAISVHKTEMELTKCVSNVN